MVKINADKWELVIQQCPVFVGNGILRRALVVI